MRVNYKSNIFYNNHDIRILVKYLLEKKINNKLMKMFIISEDILLLKGKFLGKTINILLNRCKVYLLVTVKKENSLQISYRDSVTSLFLICKLKSLVGVRIFNGYTDTNCSQNRNRNREIDQFH